jgi:chromosomal replication initiator protein
VDIEAESLVLGVPNALVRERLDGKYRALVEEAVTESATIDLTVQFEMSAAPTLFDALETNGGESQSAAGPNLPSDEVQEIAIDLTDSGTVADVGRRYTFDSFVAGTSNRFAHAAALSVAERPGGSFNPLFIYGSAGLGKTHLLKAIGHYINDQYPDLTVKYVSTETFLNELIDSIKNSEGNAFKRRYRSIDVLLLDDVQFIAGKERLQEELFHTFNDLHGKGHQIVLSSDRKPDEIPTLEDRLRSRFKSGLLCDVQPPEIETRMAILRKKADRDGYFLPNEVCEFIAENITNNIRELEGALNRVTAYANIHSEAMDRDLAESVLRDVISDSKPRPITVKMILAETVNQFSFSLEDLTGRSRRRPLVNARQVAMYVARELTDLSFPAIAQEFGGRDHTTVMHACDKITQQMIEKSQTYHDVTTLDKAVRARAKAGDD